MSAADPTPAPVIGTPAFFENPYPTYRALLDSGTRTVRLGPHHIAVTHYRDCIDVLRDPRLSAVRVAPKLSHLKQEQRLNLGSFIRTLSAMMLLMDPPQHTRVRKLLHRFFSPESVSTLRPRVQSLFEEFLEATPTGVEIDFMSQLAHPFPALVIGEILGVPRDRWDDFRSWSDTIMEFFAVFQPPIELVHRADQAFTELGRFLEDLAEVKRADPSEDLISFMLASEEDGDRLSHQEFLSQAILLLFAGHETTRNLLGNGLSLLLRHPEAMNQLRRNPGIVRSALEEFLRFEGPLQGNSRMVLADTDFAGEHFRAGDAIYTLLGCANRDASQFPDPDRLDLMRKNNAHLTFGAGAHACLGLHLARLEGQIAFPALLARFPVIELRERQLDWTQALALRGLKHLKVVLRAATD